jgi:hypothetical protein
LRNKGRLGRLRQIPPRRWAEFWRAVLTDVLLISASLVFAIGLVADFQWSEQDARLLAWLAPMLSLVGVGALFSQGLYRVHSRYAGLPTCFACIKASAGSARLPNWSAGVCLLQRASVLAGGVGAVRVPVDHTAVGAARWASPVRLVPCLRAEPVAVAACAGGRRRRHGRGGDARDSAQPSFGTARGRLRG